MSKQNKKPFYNIVISLSILGAAVVAASCKGDIDVPIVKTDTTFVYGFDNRSDNLGEKVAAAKKTGRFHTAWIEGDGRSFAGIGSDVIISKALKPAFDQSSDGFYVKGRGKLPGITIMSKKDSIVIAVDYGIDISNAYRFSNGALNENFGKTRANHDTSAANVAFKQNTAMRQGMSRQNGVRPDNDLSLFTPTTR